MPAPVAVIPIHAPIAPQSYDKRDEDRWRQMVEQAIRDLAASGNITTEEGAADVTKRVEFFSRINGQNNADNILVSEMLGYTREGMLGEANVRWLAESGSRATVVFTDADDRRSILLKPGTTDAVGDAVHLHFQLTPPGSTVGARTFVDFRETFGNFVATPAPDLAIYKPPAWSISALCRKETSGGTTNARIGFGFGDVALIYQSGLVSRIGMFGDGVSGYRFGSLHCPDGLGAGHTAATDIDGGAVQPAAMVSPGTNWFHVRIKIVPPTPAQSGRWGCYLNGQLIKAFTDPANFPRGSQGTDRNYRLIQPALYAFSGADPDATEGLIVTDLRITIEDNWVL